MASADTLLKQARRALLAGHAGSGCGIRRAGACEELEARHGEALFDLGNLLAEREAPATAIAVFERALQIFPGHPGLLINLGAQLDRSGDPARAERCYRDVLQRAPDDITALANLAHLLFVQGHHA